MKILIACDMEGVTGVVSWKQVDPDSAEYQRFRKFYTEDVNAAIQGAYEGGAQEVVVVDGHWFGTNLLVEELDPRARWNQGVMTSRFSMVQGIDDSFNGVFFVGYHARSGSQGALLDHTWSSDIASVWLNDDLVGEYGLNAAVAGYFGVPVVMISGDQVACAQACELLGTLETAVVKQASGRYSAECLSPTASHELIHVAARRATLRLKKQDVPAPYVLETPITLTVDFVRSELADRAALFPGCERDGLRIAVTTEDMCQTFMAFRTLTALAGL